MLIVLAGISRLIFDSPHDHLLDLVMVLVLVWALVSLRPCLLWLIVVHLLRRFAFLVL